MVITSYAIRKNICVMYYLKYEHFVFILLVVELIVIASLCATSNQAINLQYHRQMKNITEFKWLCDMSRSLFLT